MTNILISQLGVADPIQNNHDGAMLHIYRHYPIDKVVLIDTGATKYKKDDFVVALNSIREIKRGKVEFHQYETKLKAALFEECQDIFVDVLINLLNENTSNSDIENIFLNLTSGTPALISAVYSLAQIYPDATPIQVLLPERIEYKRSEILPTIDELIISNEDNNPDSDNRCEEVPKPNLLRPLMDYYMDHKFSKEYKEKTIIICEGESDKIYLQKIFEANGISEDDVFIVSEGGWTAAARNYMNFSKLSSEVFCVLDGDVEYYTNNKRYQQIIATIPKNKLYVLNRDTIEEYNSELGKKPKVSQQKIKYAKKATIDDLRELEAELMPLIEKLKV